MEKKWFYCEQCCQYSNCARTFLGSDGTLEHSCLTCGHRTVIKEKCCKHKWIPGFEYATRTCHCGKTEKAKVIFEWPTDGGCDESSTS